MSTWPTQRDGLTSTRRRLGVIRDLNRLLVPFLGVTLFVRILTDDRSASNSRYSGSLDLSAVIALLFVLVSCGLLLSRRHGVRPTALAVLWLCVGMSIAVHTSGDSTETLREGIREVSAVALFVIIYNARGTVTLPTAARLVQLAGLLPALLALYQLATNTGMDVAHSIRANGTFAHPDSAAMFFAIAATASLWRYLDGGRRRDDAILTTVFVAALVATFSIDGLFTMAAMLTAFGLLRPGDLPAKLVPCAIATVAVLVFFATPLGTHRIAGETSPETETTSTLATRLHRWKTLLPEWEAAPIFGRGLGTTTTSESTPTNRLNFLLPHNEYLRYLVETGVVGVMILLAALAFLLRSLMRRRKTSGGTLAAGSLNAASLALAVVIGCLINSAADNTLLNSPTCYAAVLIVAAVLASTSTVQPARPVVMQTA